MSLRFATTLEDVPDQGDVLSRSGMDFMQDVLSGTLTGATICETLGFWLHAVEDGQVTFRGKPEFCAMNMMRGVHGGWYGRILDSAMSCAVMTRVPKGFYYTTLEYKVNITRALPIDTEVEALGSVQHSGRSTGVAVGEVRGLKDGRLYATGSTTCIIMKG